jgi:hypothetical protein
MKKANKEGGVKMKLCGKVLTALALCLLIGQAEAATWLIHPGDTIVPTYRYAVEPAYIGYVAPTPAYVGYAAPAYVGYAAPAALGVVVNDYWAVMPAAPSYYYPAVAPYSVVRPVTYPLVLR